MPPKENFEFIYKSISSCRSIVKSLDFHSDSFVREPVLFQRIIKGTNKRLHVLGNKVVVSDIKSKDIDYRYCEYKQIKEGVVPKEIIDRAVLTSKDGVIFVVLILLKSMVSFIS